MEEVTAHNPALDREGHKLTPISGPRDPHGQVEVPERWLPGVWGGLGMLLLSVSFPTDGMGGHLCLKQFNCRSNLTTKEEKDANQRKDVSGRWEACAPRSGRVRIIFLNT